MEILPGIHLADKGYSNTYLLIIGGKLILIDAGMDKNAKKILEYVNKLGYKPSDISYILLTHSHIDHVNGLAKIKELSNAKIAVHASESKIVSGEEKMALPKGIIEPIKFRIISLFLGYEPVKPDILLKDEDKVEGIKIMNIPGHTIGSVCFYLPDEKVLFSGDIIFYKKNSFMYPNSAYNWNESLMKASLLKISKLDFNYLLPGHYDIVGPKASDLLRNFLFPKSNI
jgi:glyoxylase-like metal-dependent hydrolase (beta-lactamase superfamily II)